MTFKEYLKKTSAKANFEWSIKKNCEEIKERMVTSAKLGINTFQIEIVRVFPDKDYGKGPKSENYYVIFIDTDFCNNDYRDVIISYLIDDLGFSKHDIETANITNSCGCCTSITVRW